MKVAVIGAGSWGTALAHLLGVTGSEVRIWARKEEVIRGINEQHRNVRYLSSQELSHNITAYGTFAECVDGAEAVAVVTPSKIMRSVARELAGLVAQDTPVVLCCKGVEEGTGLLPVEVFAEEMGNQSRFAVLAGPNHAEEVISCVPSATVIASESPETAELFQNLFVTPSFRTYTSSDVVGVEVCSACKNVIAIAVGISYGIGLGDNTGAFLMTRGQAEMSRLVYALGGDPMTCMGLAGTGDLIATCMSHHSRNRCFGEFLAEGRTLDEYIEMTHMVVEGSLACKTLLPLAERHGVDLPIAQAVRAVVWEKGDIGVFTETLLGRPLREEFYGLE